MKAINIDKLTTDEKIDLACRIVNSIASDFSTGHGSPAAERLYRLANEIEETCQ